MRACSGCVVADFPPAPSRQPPGPSWERAAGGQVAPGRRTRALALPPGAERTAAPSWCEGGDVFPPTHFRVPPTPLHTLLQVIFNDSMGTDLKGPPVQMLWATQQRSRPQSKSHIRSVPQINLAAGCPMYKMSIFGLNCISCYQDSLPFVIILKLFSLLYQR